MHRARYFILLAAAALVFLAFFVRERPVWRSGDRFAVPVDFDEGVNYATAVLSSRGDRPYHDFDFAHPPGITLVLSGLRPLASPSSVSAGFADARVAMGAVGALSVALLIGIGWRVGLPWAGLLAGLLYATYPEAIYLERGVFLEPLVNALGLAALLLAIATPRSPVIRYLSAGLCLALAAAVKLTAIVWLPGIAVLVYGQSGAAGLRYVLIGLAVGCAMFFGPFVWSDPRRFFEDVVFFQMTRPPDGDAGLALRLSWMLSWPHLAINVCAGLALFGFSTISQSQRRLFFVGAVTLALTLAALLLARGFWRQYNAQLAAPQAVLAGFVVFPVMRLISSSKMTALLARIALAVIVVATVRSAYRSGRGQASPGQAQLVDAVVRNVSRGSCFVMFEPAPAIMADRFPPSCPGQRTIIDPYLVMLVDAMRGGQRFATPAEAFATEASQERIRKALEASDVAVLDARGYGQLNQKTLDGLKQDGRVVRREPGADFLIK